MSSQKPIKNLEMSGYLKLSVNGKDLRIGYLDLLASKDSEDEELFTITGFDVTTDPHDGLSRVQLEIGSIFLGELFNCLGPLVSDGTLDEEGASHVVVWLEGFDQDSKMNMRDPLGSIRRLVDQLLNLRVGGDQADHVKMIAENLSLATQAAAIKYCNAEDSERPSDGPGDGSQYGDLS